MSISSEITRINTNIANAYTSIENKGGTLPQVQNSANLAETIDNMPSGGGAEANIFVQLIEPETKKGIWLQKEATPEHYTYDDEVFIAGEWAEDGQVANIPYSFNFANCVTLGTNIYLFGSSSYYRYAYKYDILTNTYTKLTNIPYDFYRGLAIVVNTNVYLFGGEGGTTNCYKYDTLTDTYTKMTNIPSNFSNGSGASVGTNVYLFKKTSTATNCYKYDTLTDTYTQIANLPYNLYQNNNACVSVGTNIYIFGGYQSPTNCYKYDTLTDTYTQMANIPYTISYGGSCASANTDIYLFGSGADNYRKYAYKYNTLTDTYTRLNNIPYEFNYGSCTSANTNIYLFGGNSYPTKVQVYALESKTYEQDNLVVISQGKYSKAGYDIELYSNSKDVTPPKYAFADAWYYTLQGGLDGTMPTYYGDGTRWVKIKN